MKKTDIVVIIIRNSEGRLFLHQRRDDKETFPGRYGLGAGGRIERGELPAEAAQRELLEETGLTTRLRELFELEYRDEQLNHFLHVFVTIVDSSLIRHDSNEWQWSGWLSMSDVDRLYGAGKLCPDTALVYERFRPLLGR